MAQAPIYKLVNEEELAHGLKIASTEKDRATQFWRPLTTLPVNLIRMGNYSQAKELLFQLLQGCRSVDETSYLLIHKGNPFYFLGIASYLLDEIETATFFIDASVSEDLRYGADAVNHPTPSTRFLALEGEKNDQAAKMLTQVTESKVQRVFDLYNLMPGRRLDKPDMSIAYLRERFLFPALSADSPPGWRTLATAFISFFVEWDFRNELFDLRPGKGTSEPFFLHLFKGCVLFESLLKENPTKISTGRTLGKLLTDHKNDLGLSSNPKISGTLVEILGSIPSTIDHIETAIKFTGKVRNTIGHSLSWDKQLEKSQYQQLFIMIAVSCTHSIACLY